MVYLRTHRPTRKAKADPRIGRTSNIIDGAAFCKLGLPVVEPEVGGLVGVLNALVKTGVVKVGAEVSNEENGMLEVFW